jgi:superfamily II DNA or RNA helicase
MSVNSYLGKRGYTIYKESVEERIIAEMREELFVKPFVPKSVIKPSAFPIYRENSKKMFLPRFYGEQRFGKAKKKHIGEGLSIDINFKGGLRDYQENIAQKYMKNVKEEKGGGLLEVDTGMGKTVIALNILSRVKKKTLIIVHKEFLLEQWIERITEFIPDARVGKIQGKTQDVEDKDICIGMLQSLSMKNYDENIFEDFGMMIIDEVHHMGAEVFSQALLKVVCSNVLGLSATMERKDGLTKVFKMFCGNIIHTERRDTSSNKVLIKAVNYISEDEEFNAMMYNFKGDPAYSSMVGKLCKNIDRSNFILKILADILKNGEGLQIMILAHNKNLLKYLYESIVERKIGKGDVGYYVGGMKKDDLKESEEKKIIVATYAMASEGLDIKTLTTLIMATPKSDVVQVVGRILRTNHGKAMVVDVVDGHEIFQRQYYTRRRFYNKQKYEIVRSSNVDYKDVKDEEEEDEEEKKKPVNQVCLFDEIIE